MLDVDEIPITTTRPHPGCEWVGIAEDGWVTYVCGRPATEMIEEAEGAVHYACREHLASVRAKAGHGAMLHRVAPGPARPYPEAVL